MNKKLLVSAGVAIVLILMGALLIGEDEETVKTADEATVIETDDETSASDYEGNAEVETTSVTESQTGADEFHSIVDYSTFDTGANNVIKEVNKKLDRAVTNGEVKAFFISKENGIATLKVAESRFRGINAGDTIQVDYGEVKFGNYSMTFFEPAGNENGVWQRRLVPN